MKKFALIAALAIVGILFIGAAGLDFFWAVAKMFIGGLCLFLAYAVGKW